MSFQHLNHDVIRKQISDDFQSAKKMGYNVFMALPFGSINYNLDTENSDIDTKIIVIPSFRDLLEKNILNKTYRENGEGSREVSIVDIREFFAYLKSNSAYYWEFLNSRYQLINHSYYKQYIKLYNLQEDILRSNPLGGVISLHGQFYSYYKSFSSQVRNYYWYNPKTIIGMERIYKQLVYYDEYFSYGINFDKILWRVDEEREELLRHLNQDFSLQEAQKYVTKLRKELDTFYTQLYKKYKCVDKEKLPVNMALDSLLEEIAKKHLKEFDVKFKEN